MGHRLVAGDAFRIRQQIEAEIAVPPQRVGIVVDALRGVVRLVLVLGEQRPDQAMGRGIVIRRLYPSDHLHLGKSTRDAVLVALLHPVFQILQKVVGIPVLGIIILDVAFLDVADHHDPPVIRARADDKADDARIVDDIAERPQDASAFGLRYEEITGRQLQRGLVDQGNIRGSGGACRAGGLPGGNQFRLSRGFARRRSSRKCRQRPKHDEQRDDGGNHLLHRTLLE